MNEKNEACNLKEELSQKSFRKHSPLKETRFIIAVGSGKGGVGKTTASVLLSLALREEGFKVGLYDLDFYGPNATLLLTMDKVTPLRCPEGFKPAEICGLKVMSLSFLVSEREPLFMRGLMAGKLLQELTMKVVWGPLDFLVLDLPPSTGDIFLSMLSLFNPDGFVLVTTPHRMALADSLRTLSILKVERVPLLGIIQNMADLYGEPEEFSAFLEETKVPLLLEIPYMKFLSQGKPLEEFGESKDMQELLKKLAEAFLKKVFRFH